MNATRSCAKTRKNDEAFSRQEMVALLAALAMLAAIQLPSVANSRSKSDAASCLHNHRQLANAWRLVAEDNNDALVGNLDGGEVQSVANSNKTWALGWFDFQGGNPFPVQYGGRANTNTYVLAHLSPLAPYLGQSAEAFKCTADTSLSLGTRGAARVRSVSMNGYLGYRASLAPDGGAFTSGYRQFKRTSDLVRPGPAKTFVFIDEREDSIGDGWFAIDMGGFDPPESQLFRIVDYPADWHNRGANISFADGHTETWHWRDSRTMPPHRRGTLIALGVGSRDNEDVARIQAAASSKVK